MVPGVCIPLLGSLSGPLTPHNSHARRSRHCIRPLGCGVRSVVRWGAHHLLQLGLSWGIGAMPLCPRDGRALIDHLRGPNTPPPQPHSALPTPYPTVLSYGSGVVRWCAHHSSACRVAMGHWGQCLHIPGRVDNYLVTFGGHTHTSTRHIRHFRHGIRPLV